MYQFNRNTSHPKIALVLAFCLPVFALTAQLTLRVNAIPANTPAGAKIHVAGSFQNWDPASTAHILTETGGGKYEITVTPPVGAIEFKFTRGSWATVEGNANGTFLPNRTYNYTGAAATLDMTILSWEDLGSGGNTGSTAAPNVSILDNAFYIPQLNRSRRIWLYLPPDYQATTKRYPVLYMHDGQNLFDVKTSFSGEWKVDESLNNLHAQGDYGCIVVGIDNGGASRLDEYSPWENPQYGGGEGAAYIEFIVNTLKPFIDQNYRTLPGRLTTGMGGSSMGGLISEYGLIERQDVFSKAAVFSPAFWFAGQSSVNHVLAKGKQADVRTYFLAGGDEPVYVETDMAEVADAMVAEGFAATDIYFHVPSDGQHSEWFWAREFPAAYVWLFQNSVSATTAANGSDVQIFPNPAGDWLRVSGLNTAESVDFQIVGTDGKIWRDSSTFRPGSAIWTGDLPDGIYFLKLAKGGKTLAARRFAVAGK